jgi:hypothetical protein
MTAKLFFVIFVSCFAKVSTCQSNKWIKYLDNQTAEFTIARSSITFVDSNSVLPPQTFVVTTLTEKVKKKLAKVSEREWIQLLHNGKTDWAANLYLYEKYDLDATDFEVVKTKDQWRLCCKQKDLLFWERKFRK